MTRKSTSAWVNARGASVWALITPITVPSRAAIGTLSSDWKRSSSSSGTYTTRGSSSRLSGMNAGSLRSAAHQASPLPRSSAILPIEPS